MGCCCSGDHNNDSGHIHVTSGEWPTLLFPCQVHCVLLDVSSPFLPHSRSKPSSPPFSTTNKRKGYDSPSSDRLTFAASSIVKLWRTLRKRRAGASCRGAGASKGCGGKGTAAEGEEAEETREQETEWAAHEAEERRRQEQIRKEAELEENVLTL